MALALDLLGSLDSAEATIRCALERKESRGSHQRSDYPETSDAQRVNHVISLNDDGTQSIESHPVPAVPENLQSHFMEYSEPAVDGRLLE